MTIGPGYVGPDSASYGRTTGDRNWTEMSEILGRGATNVTVGGNLNLAGSTIASQTNALTLTAGSLTWSDNIDRDNYRSTSFGISGLSGLYNSETGQGGTGQTRAGGNSLIGGITFTNQTDREEGVTYAVIGEGQVRIGDATGEAALGTIRRDIDGRQVITLSQHDRTSLDIPLVSFQQLQANATSAANLFRALTTPIPADVAAQGPAAADYFQRLVANGFSSEAAQSLLEREDYQRLIRQESTWRDAVDAYAKQGTSVPAIVRLAIADGLRLDFSNGVPEVLSDTGCETASAGCRWQLMNGGFGYGSDLNDPDKLRAAATIKVDEAERTISELGPRIAELLAKGGQGNLSPSAKGDVRPGQVQKLGGNVTDVSIKFIAS